MVWRGILGKWSALDMSSKQKIYDPNMSSELPVHVLMSVTIRLKVARFLRVKMFIFFLYITFKKWKLSPMYPQAAENWFPFLEVNVYSYFIQKYLHWTEELRRTPLLFTKYMNLLYQLTSFTVQSHYWSRLFTYDHWAHLPLISKLFVTKDQEKKNLSLNFKQ